MSSEVMLGYAWLSSTLSGNSTLMSQVTTIRRAYAPPETVPPWIILAHQSGIDVVTANAFRLMTSLLYQVKVVGPARLTAALASVAAQFDTLIGSPPTSGDIVMNSVTVGRVLACWRESPLQLDELVDGEQWTNVGGLYRLQLEQVS